MASPTNSTIVRSAAPLLLALMVGVFLQPTAAFAHDGLPDAGLTSSHLDSAKDPMAAALLPTREDAAVAKLPLDTDGGHCASTGVVAGLGRGCRTGTGMVQLELAGGRTIQTHGSDTLVSSQALDFTSSTTAALDAASVADVTCVDANDARNRYELVYARPAGTPDRTSVVAPTLRQAFYESSAFLDAESRDKLPAAGRRLPVLCANGEPVVRTVVLAIANQPQRLTDVAAALGAAGLPTTRSASNPHRFVVYVDVAAASGAYGTGEMFPDSTPGTANSNNLGGAVAVEWDWSVGRRAHWDVIAHEVIHTLGGVQNGSPRSSGAGHCFDGRDVMCYADGGSGAGGYVTTACSVTRLDCNSDTYFNPAPATGSWLASHWNVASTRNAWLAPRDPAGSSTGAVPAPGAVALSVAASTMLTATWADGVGASAWNPLTYTAALDRWDGSQWVEIVAPRSATGTTSTTFTGLTPETAYRMRLVPGLRSGDVGAEVTATASTPPPPLDAPVLTRSAAVGSDRTVIEWVPATRSDVLAYDVELQRVSGAWIGQGMTQDSSFTVAGLDPSTPYRMRVRQRSAIAVGPWSTSGELRTDARPAAPALPTVPSDPLGAIDAGDGRIAVELDYPAGATNWQLRSTSGRHVVMAAGRITTPGAGRAQALVRGLHAASTYDLALTIWGGRTIVATRTGSVTIAPDTIAPDAMRLTQSPTRHASRIKLSFRTATDVGASGLAGYQVQRTVGSDVVQTMVSRSQTSATVSTGTPDVAALVRIRAVDNAGNAGPWLLVLG